MSISLELCTTVLFVSFSSVMSCGYLPLTSYSPWKRRAMDISRNKWERSMHFLMMDVGNRMRYVLRFDY